MTRERTDVKSMFRMSRDPDLMPIGAWVYVLCSVLAMALICIASEAGALGKLSACGIVLGIFGSGVLYWETVADEAGLRSIGNEVLRSVDGRRLSVSEVGTVAMMACLSFLQAFILMALVALRFREGHDAARALVGTGLTTVLLVGPALIVYAAQKGIRIWGTNWLAGLDLTPADRRKAYIRRSLRLLGFAALVMAGAMQLPAALH